MDRWRKAYTYCGFEDLDRKWDRFIVYGTAAAFWVNLAAWLITRDGITPGLDSVLEWLILALLSVPGNARVVFLIALGPNRSGEWTTFYHNPDARAVARRKWWRIRAKLRRNQRREQGERRPRRGASRSVPREVRNPWATRWARPPGTGQAVTPPPRPVQPPPRPTAPAQPRPRRGGSAPGTLVKILVGLTLFAVCGGFWLTGGTIVSPSDKATEPPRLRNVAEKRHMLDLINQARSRAGVSPVAMGRNNVAQIQADQLLEDCVSSHWGTNGLKPYQRYSLAGGYQVNGENFSGHGECGLADTLLHWNDDPIEMATDSVEGLLSSPGHRETMLSPEYRRVNLGLAWDRNVFKVVQHFEGDYVELDSFPVIDEGTLELDGRLISGYSFTGQVPLLAMIVYDPAPKRLTTGQLARTYCYGHGEGIGVFIPPSRLLRDEFELTSTVREPVCVDPYGVGRSAAEPESQEESARMFQESKERSERVRETELSMSVRKARELTVDGREFSLRADMTELLEEWGPGVYTVVLIAELEGRSAGEPDTAISEYSIFHEVRVPTGYAR